MALSFDLRLGVVAALFLFGAWASQAAAQETSIPRPEKPIKTMKETLVVSSSPASPTTTTPPVQSSVARINTRVQMADSIVQPQPGNCDKNNKFMGGWSPLVIGAVLFSLLHPGLLFQCPGNDRKVEFKSMKTNRKAMFFHSIIFIVIYAIIIKFSHGKI
ncbi:PREDICTED: uncharacterized protein LOC109153956 [Ipomoea nil]|uniref:uncharacterized protein LOC109153956 n=1 Tax=Ipomoea nil TaxID=35883 RepID=UPI000901DDAB|nr:PREDICTED: uncharacterized protein LOC109153956 [Ipomoea nil]